MSAASSISSKPAGFSEWLGDDGCPRERYARLAETVTAMGHERMARRWDDARRQAELDAFTFYLDPNEFRTTPTDWIPRVIPAEHWATIAAGVEQRVRAINHFLMDLYGDGQDVVPDEVVFTSRYFYPEAHGFRPRGGVFVHIYGADLVHMGGGRYYLLEDNARIPSGISYQIKSLEIVSRILPEFLNGYDIEPYNIRDGFHGLFRSLSDSDSPTVGLLTDGKFGSAFFEHRYLSDLLGIPLVEGSDLYVGQDGRVYARTLDSHTPVDVIYRRVEDLDMFVPGLRDAHLSGKVALVNGFGAGAADDKLTFAWVPKMIERYLGESPILPQARTYNLLDMGDRSFSVGNLDDLVIKSRHGYGGSGVYVMPDLPPERRAEAARLALGDPESYVVQETLDFSRHVVFNERGGEREGEENGALDHRHIDLRVFAVQDGDGAVTVFPGGLTRVARPGGRITNNSSGGLCKPTWVVKQT